MGSISRAIRRAPPRLAKQATHAYPDHHALALAWANAHFLAGGGEEIIPVLARLSAIEAETFFDPLTAYDYRIFGEWAYDLLGAVYARFGQRTKAGEAFAQAARLAPDNIGYRAKAVAFSPAPSD